ncbi:MAG: 4-hydroxythreonine-4-phosphate dehydrogenase PdxA [Phycisphaerales bacterium]|nr:4-hydroxythreonine-4-phosphate dehydrogenase PdxA [Phycisphaerales bacterium]
MVSPRDIRPRIGLTMGDPGGIGPELIARCLAEHDLRLRARFCVHGCPDALAWAQQRCGIDASWTSVPACASEPPPDDVIVLHDAQYADMAPMDAMPSKQAGLASKQWVESAIADAMRAPDDPRRTDAIVTAPICKASWGLAGYTWPGHTELLAARTRARRACMVFESPRLRVALATVHVPLMDLRNLLTIGRVFEPIDLGHAACLELGMERPRIAVCGLNPHAGEGGRIGDEETRVIAPAISMARERGIDASGPFPADTIFRDAAAGRWDMVVAMYHDQGLIPLKLLSDSAAVNWTVGLPIVRTSPDHGTAFDIAGKGVADHGSMCRAIELAIRLSEARKRDSALV